jgi:tRNA(Arg) A34 adenosine deaminase TadA
VRGPAADFEAAWRALAPPTRRALEVAYDSLASGGLACGAVISDAAGQVISEGRNRAYDPPGGADALQGTPLAHAEMNAFAAVPTGRDLADCTLLSTQEPCAMCAAAAAFLEVGTVRHVAPDPWALASGQPGNPISEGLTDDVWVVTANLLFLLSIASKRGVEHPTVAANRELEPETTRLVLDLITAGADAPTLTAGRSLRDVLSTHWDQITAAAAARARRVGRQDDHR